LRPATGQRGAIHSITLFRLMKHDLISEAHFSTLHRERPKLQRTYARPTSNSRKLSGLTSDLRDAGAPFSTSYFLLSTSYSLLSYFLLSWLPD
jgi:hypothetical protein